MALYEGIALIQEKQAVVLDLGTEYTKFGFTGEGAPRCIVRSQYWCSRRRRWQRVHDYGSADELHHHLVNMLHLLYFRHVLVNPKERKVVVVESLLTPTLFRETLAKVLFTHYEVSGVLWADSPRTAALTLGAPLVLVVDVGAQEAQVAAVVHGSVLVSGVQAVPVGARELHQELARLLDHDNGRDLALTEEELEDIKVKTCFVIDRDRAELWRKHCDEGGPAPEAARGVSYPRREGAVLVSGRARELAAEVMFRRDLERSSLADAVVACLLRAPVDARRALAASLLLCGGGAALPGLAARLQAELRALAADEPALRAAAFKFHRAPAPPSAVAWCGAGAAWGGGGAEARVQAREHYARSRRVRDWPCLLDNTPHDHPARALHAA